MKKIRAKYNNTSIISYKKNLGKSAALKIGLKKCKTGIVVFYDCDLPYFSYLPKANRKEKPIAQPNKTHENRVERVVKPYFKRLNYAKNTIYHFA